MDASEMRKIELEMTDKEAGIYQTLKRENQFLQVVLSLAKGETDPTRLGQMLYRLQIGHKMDYNKDLKGFISGVGALKQSHKEVFNMIIDQNNGLYKEIQETICTKLAYTQEEIEQAQREKEESTEIPEVDDPRGIKPDDELSKEQIIASLLGRKSTTVDTKNSYDDFKIKQVKMSLKTSLSSIKTSTQIIEDNLKHIDITRIEPGSQDAKALASLVRRANKASSDWIEYLVSEKMKKKFIFHESNLLTLFNETLGPAKRVWELSTVMEQEMLDAGLIREQEIEELAKQKLSLDAKKYWKDEPVREAKIEQEVEPENIDTAYRGNIAYEKDKNLFKKCKYFDDVIRSEKDIERARQGLGVNFKVTNREIAVTNAVRKLLNVYYKIPEDTRDIIEKITNGIGLRSNNIFTAVFGYFIGRAAKDPEIIFAPPPIGGAGDRHRQFVRDMGSRPPERDGHHHGHHHEPGRPRPPRDRGGREP